MTYQPHEFWQILLAPGTHDRAPATGHSGFYPAVLPDGSQLVLPIRVLPGDGQSAVASLIINQASFAVEDALASALTELVAPFVPDIIVGVPTLGLPLAANVARRLGHSRIVPLGTSRKFWYRDDLSVPLKSITTPGGGKTLFLDPRMLPLLEHRRVALIDDVISSGQSITSALNLLERAGVKPVVIGCAMLQGEAWKTALSDHVETIVAPLHTPRLRLVGQGWFE